MSADFWAGYVSGAIGILIGNPLDLIKVRLQASSSSSAASSLASTSRSISPSLPSSSTSPPLKTSTPYFRNLASLTTGSAAPVLGYGALNALLFVSYNRAAATLSPTPNLPPPLWTTFIAGAIGGLATWAVSTPTELIKCRAQLAEGSSAPRTSTTSASSLAMTRHVLATSGIRGLYAGGTVTALRDSVGYAFYFWSYEALSRYLETRRAEAPPIPASRSWIDSLANSEAARVLVCGGVAGVVTWASIFPLDVIKTRVQAQEEAAVRVNGAGERTPLVGEGRRRMGAMEVARQAYREGGMRVFFRGLGVCSVRAFIVNAVQWATYEWIMRELGQGRGKGTDVDGMTTGSL
jgi:solute carrier family 25 (mitochondrial carnitine/acylcarnitine transporter), member 20/29